MLGNTLLSHVLTNSHQQDEVRRIQAIFLGYQQTSYFHQMIIYMTDLTLQRVIEATSWTAPGGSQTRLIPTTA